MNDPETVLLIDSWHDQRALDAHHASPMMQQLAALREKYGLHMTVERYSGEERPEGSNSKLKKSIFISCTERQQCFAHDLP